MDIRSDSNLQLITSDFTSDFTDLTTTEAILCKQIKNLTKERDELICEERELRMALKQRKENGKNIRARVKSVLNHPKTITTELTSLDTLEKRRRSVTASLTVLGRQLVTLDQQIIDARDQRIAEAEEKRSLADSQHTGSSSSISSCQISLQLVN